MKKEENSKLFEEFPPVTVEEWEKKILEDLKGADYEKKLIWKTPENFSCKPYYTIEDLEKLSFLQNEPGEIPYIRTDKVKKNEWKSLEIINEPNFSKANSICKHAIKFGANALGVNVRKISSITELTDLLDGINPIETEIHFLHSKSYPETFDLFCQYLDKKNINSTHVRGSFNFDPFGYLLLHGEFYTTKENNIVEAKYLLENCLRNLPNFFSITINGHIFHDSGSTIVQEIAFSLASAVEYINMLSDKGIAPEHVINKILFYFSISSDYFMEIAKLRAARMLWSAITKEYIKDVNKVPCLRAHCRTSITNMTLFDPYVNMLRATTEVMSAVLGGADYVSVLPFDSIFKMPDDFSRRVALNIHNILNYEGYFNKVIDPAAGSYYIENLTKNIAEKSWDLFLEIEEKGGFSECVLKNVIQEKIEQSKNQRESEVSSRKIVLVGTNQYPNLKEEMLDKIDQVNNMLHIQYEQSTNPLCKTLKPFRLSEEFEKLRLNTELYVKKGNKRPSVFLFTFGNLAMRRARATFTTNFFGCAGYLINDNPGFTTIEEGIEAALKSSSEIVVICSSDEEYATIAGPIAQGIKSVNPEIKVIVAGNPVAIIDTLKSQGVDDFIHIRSNVLETLKKYNNDLDIN